MVPCCCFWETIDIILASDKGKQSSFNKNKDAVHIYYKIFETFLELFE